VTDPNRRVFAEPVAVWVLHEGAEYPGRLSEWSRWSGDWRGLTTYTVAPGSQFMRWLPADRIRPRESP
jgi:hypothetical protein